MFVVYHIKSTHMVGPLPRRSHVAHTQYAHVYKFAAQAKRACDKFNSVPTHISVYGPEHTTLVERQGPGDYGWCSADHYQKHVVRMVERTNLMSGKTYVEPSNTPGYCSPSSEAYWSM